MLSLRALDVFYGRAQALFGVDLDVPEGSVTALLGRNGAGKSTTLKAVMGLLPVARGEITLEGTAIANRQPHEIARMGVGYVPEDRRIFTDLTVSENLATAQRPPRGDAPAWTDADIYHLFPNLYELRHRRAGRTSGGEQQMLALARTLMGNPRLLLLDEPSEGLAPVVVQTMAGAIRTLTDSGVTILMSEQNRAFAERVSTRTVRLAKGRVESEAPA